MTIPKFNQSKWAQLSRKGNTMTVDDLSTVPYLDNIH